ncbi:MAG TPA: GntR family transcriptional regulator, partial [Pseudomonas sp.]|nr:GntR family transcriptional regulator [Pseudomonas sp.]
MPIESRTLVRKRSNNLAQGVVDALTQRILLGQLKPGEKLPSESTIVGEHGVSRTVVREAISRLKHEGVVEPRQGSGVFVTEQAGIKPLRIDYAEVSSPDAVLQIVELRRAIEAEVAAQAAKRRTDEDIAAIDAALARIGSDVAGGGGG